MRHRVRVIVKQKKMYNVKFQSLMKANFKYVKREKMATWICTTFAKDF